MTNESARHWTRRVEVFLFSGVVCASCGLPDARPSLPVVYPGGYIVTRHERQRKAVAKPPAVPPVLPFEVPRSLRVEHERIQAALSRAESAPEPVSGAARELSELLGPHVEREEVIALAPLGLLGPLAAGQYADPMQTVLPRTDLLRSELPELLRAHDMIRAALRRLEAAARQSSNADAERLAQDLVAHLSLEEEVLYPAALLVGAVVQARAEQLEPP